MEGPEAKPLSLEDSGEEVDGRGMIPRAVEQVFEVAVALRSQGWQVRGHCGHFVMCIGLPFSVSCMQLLLGHIRIDTHLSKVTR